MVENLTWAAELGMKKGGKNRFSLMVKVISMSKKWIYLLGSLSFVMVGMTGCTRQVKQSKHDKALGTYRLSVYWLAHENWYKGRRRAPLYQKRRRIAWVSERFARAIRMQGSGRLRNGWIVQYKSRCRYKRRFCLRVKVINAKRYPMGIGAGRVALQPFRSVAADRRQFPHGTYLYIPALGRLIRKGGWAHNGCFAVHDRGGKIRGRRLDLFTGNRVLFKRHLQKRLPKRIKVYAGDTRCSTKIARR
ncbi:MAG: hypothetical protein CL920_29645 [Deltaproteobacteria bacterium]|nr:hypothetical protein [Deltaproteobacteria bacterium]MBU52877.1 hypothetical protein [Deltaproteobacteria bacterium]